MKMIVKTNVCFVFCYSTSPSQLQEVTLCTNGTLAGEFISLFLILILSSSNFINHSSRQRDFSSCPIAWNYDFMLKNIYK